MDWVFVCHHGCLAGEDASSCLDCLSASSSIRSILAAGGSRGFGDVLTERGWLRLADREGLDTPGTASIEKRLSGSPRFNSTVPLTMV